jgi:hypothetical protein
VTQVIAGGMEARARSLLGDASIEVITGAPVESPAVLVPNYLNGTMDAPRWKGSAPRLWFPAVIFLLLGVV